MADDGINKAPVEPFSLNIYLPVEKQRKSFDEYWGRLVAFLEELRSHTPLLGEWYLQARDREKALRRNVFQAGPECLEELKRSKDFRTAAQNEVFGYTFGLWNGREEGDLGISLTAVLGWRNRDFLTLRLPYNHSPANQSLFHTDQLLTLVGASVRAWNPRWAAVVSDSYQRHHAAFKDRRGVGWLAYVDAHIEKRAIPEAASLKYIETGTVVVTTQEVFSSENRGHVERANRIEARLADLQLLPLLAG
ncbi:hypothetical protein CYFUS_002510 [Cystobacter fuscus]|uniref:Immunity protein 52 domain-containing protein n=1 Tax=Cystobacter fuscus TaxID=43 RepID=A0A250IZC8_9BACT|nr:Imm52 family immunity protein [Cystobacter fuscus]ATB37089.1 hypothetical protein CYFUS_002510 [Cystobacter fuscus]